MHVLPVKRHILVPNIARHHQNGHYLLLSILNTVGHLDDQFIYHQTHEK